MTKVQISDNYSIEVPDLKEIPLKDWLAEGERLFGTDFKKWRFKCPNCGHIQTIEDFLELKKNNIIKSDFDVGKVVYYSCIGRFDTRIPKEDVGTIFDKVKKSPCNYTLGGLFCFAKVFVIDDEGQKRPVFEFASK